MIDKNEESEPEWERKWLRQNQQRRVWEKAVQDLRDAGFQRNEVIAGVKELLTGIRRHSFWGSEQIEIERMIAKLERDSKRGLRQNKDGAR